MQRSAGHGSFGGPAPGLVAALVAGGSLALGAGALPALAAAGLLALPFAAISWAAGRQPDGEGPAVEASTGSDATGAGLLLGAGGAGVVLMVFGGLLKAHTHHKGLAGVTFAIVGLGVLAGAAALGVRVAHIAARSSLALRITTAASLLFPLVVLALLSARAGLGSALEPLALLLAAAAGSRLTAPRPVVSRASWGVAALLTVAGIALSLQPAVSSQLARGGLLSATLAQVFAEAPAAAESPR